MSFSDFTPGQSNRQIDNRKQSAIRSNDLGLVKDANVDRKILYTGSERVLSTNVSQLGDSLRDFQKSCDILEKKITQMKSKKVNRVQKTELDSQLREAKESMTRLKGQFDFHQRQLDSKLASKTPDVAQNRQVLSKLIKDFDVLKNKLKFLTEETVNIKVINSTFEQQQFSDGNDSTRPGEIVINSRLGIDGRSTKGPQLLQTVQDNEIERAILEERDQEIRKINQDLLLVNEMFKDMATLVKSQDSMIEEIAVSTEKSHERAQAGLKQVQQAASYQSSCALS